MAQSLFPALCNPLPGRVPSAYLSPGDSGSMRTARTPDLYEDDPLAEGSAKVVWTAGKWKGSIYKSDKLIGPYV